MNAPPDRDVIEVSLLGPGYGESVVVHLGDGEWMIVDSCVRREPTGRPRSAPIAYLEEIGVAPEQVATVVATHWHGDHIGCFTEVVGACVNANFCFPVAMRTREFLAFASDFATHDPSPLASPTREIVECLELLQARRRQPTFVVADTLIRRAGAGAEVHALSPSQAMVSQFLAKLASNMPIVRQPRRSVGDLEPNAVAVALMIEVGSDVIVLGADLIEKPGGNWSGILATSQAAKGKKATIFKVPHHGSVTGECAGVWSHLLLPAPFAILTPFNRGRKPLPSRPDVARILGYTDKAFSTAKLTPAKRRRDPGVERTLRENGWKVRHAEPKLGQIRLRKRLGAGEEWQVELLGAMPLAAVHG